ncbi:MAG: helix-turn-helix domain-containing protein [Candidatus Heimdallarchaeaceae archaeon]
MESTLEKIGLSQDEIQVYSTVVQFGTRTIGQIQSYYKQTADVISSALGSLVTKGYIKEIKARNTEGTSYFIPLPPQIKLTEDVSMRLENELKALSDDVKNDWNNTMKTFRGQLSSFHGQITESTDNHSQELGIISKQFLDSVSEVVSTGKNDVQEAISKIKTDTGSITTSHSDNLKKAIQRIQENISSTFDTTIHRVGEHHESFKTKIQETYTTLETEHTARSQGQLDDILEKVEGIKTNISTLLEQFNSKADEKKSLIVDNTREVNKKLISDSKLINKESTTKSIETINKIVSDYQTNLDEYQTKVQSILSSLNEELKKLEDLTSNRIKDAIEKAKDSAVAVLQQNETQFQDLLSKIKTLSVEKLGELISQTETKTSEMKSKLVGNLNDYLSDFEKNSDSLLTLLQGGINDGLTLFEDTLSKSIKNVSDQIKTFFGEIMDDFDELKLSVNEDLQKSLTDFVNLSSSQKEDMNKKIKELNSFLSISIQESVQQNSTKLTDVATEINAEADIALASVKKKEQEYLKKLEKDVLTNQETMLNFLSNTVSTFELSSTEYVTEISSTIDNYSKKMNASKKRLTTTHTEFKENYLTHLNELKTTALSDIKENIDTNTNTVTNFMDTKNEEIKTRIVSFSEEFAKKGRDIRDEVPNLVQINYQSSLESIQELDDQFKASVAKLTEINEAFQDLDQKQLQKVFGKEAGPRMAHLIGTMNADINNLKYNTESKIDEVIKTFTSSMESLSTDIFNKMNTRIDDLSQLSDSEIEEISQKIEAAKSGITNQLKESFNSMKENIKTTFTTYETSFTELQDTNTQALGSIVGKEHDSINSLKSKVEEATTGLTNKINEVTAPEKVQDLYQGHIDTLTKNSNSFVSNVVKIIDGEKEKIDATKTTILQTMSVSEQEMSKKLSDTFKDLEKTNKLITDNATNSFQAIINKTGKYLDEVIKAGETITDEEEGEVEKTKMQLHIEEGLQGLLSSKEEIFRTMRVNNSEVMQKLQETIKTNIDDHSTIVKGVSTSMDSNMKILQSEFEGAKKALDTDVSVTLDEASASYSQQTEIVSKEIQNFVDQEVQAFVENSEGLLADLSVSPEKASSLDKTIKEAKTELNKITEAFPEWLDSDNAKYATDLTVAINEYHSQAQAILDELYEETKKDLEKAYSNISSEYDRSITSVEEAFEKEGNDFQLNISHQINSLVSNSDSNSSALVTNIQSTKDSLLDASSSVHEIVDTDLKGVEKAVEDIFESFYDVIVEKMDKTLENSKASASTKNEYASKLQTFKEEFISNSLKEIDSVDANITGILKSIPSKIDIVLAATGESMKLLRSVLNLGKGVEPAPIEDIWLVYGKEQTFSTMMSTLRNTKSSATIISPNLSWIDAEFLDSYGRKLEIVTNTTAHTEADNVILDKLLGMGNVIVKDDPQLTAYMGTRDGIEEGFLGHTTASGEPVLIATFNENLVGEITKIYYEFRSRPPIRK